ncbi:hypothetical protein ACN20G_02085 [Streptomyces sp. BI20]|uniref:hypothetical protein n=1 Tax=Streptomyces sp. BI20 TaxID=3403460 RepID=UPI003C75EAFB
MPIRDAHTINGSRTDTTTSDTTIVLRTVTLPRGTRVTALPTTSDELSALLATVRRGRVVTVTGRSREARGLLVREVGRRLASNFCDGTTTVTLEHPCTKAEFTHTLSDLTAPGDPGPTLPAAPEAAFRLAERDMLLVLDGTENLTEDAVGWLRRLLDVAPGVRVLAAGPRPMAVAEERVHVLRPGAAGA